MSVCIFTNCASCSRVKLVSTPCNCESYVFVPIDQEIYQVVAEYQPIKAINIVHILNARVKPEIRCTYGQVLHFLSKDKHLVSNKKLYASGTWEVLL